jgi:hypothetical protein
MDDLRRVAADFDNYSARRAEQMQILARSAVRRREALVLDDPSVRSTRPSTTRAEVPRASA